MHTLRNVREGMPGGTKGVIMDEREPHRTAGVRLRQMHPLLLLPGDVPGERDLCESTAAGKDHPSINLNPLLV